MTAGFNANPEDVNSVPIAAVYPPGSTGNLVVLQGSTLTNTDAKGNVSAPGNFNLSQINSLAVQMAGSDGMIPANILVLVPGLYNGSGSVDQWREVNGQSDNSSFGTASVGPYLYNGANWDKERNNLDNITIFASAAHTTTQTSSDMTNYNHKGIIVVLSVSAGTTPSLTLEVDGKDPVSSAYYSLLTASAAVAATGTFVYMVYPGASTIVTNTGVTQSSGMVLPRTWRVKVGVGNSNSITYSVGASLIL